MYELINSVKKDKSFIIKPVQVINQLQTNQLNQSNLTAPISNQYNDEIEVSDLQKLILLIIIGILFIIIFILIIIIKKQYLKRRLVQN